MHVKYKDRAIVADVRHRPGGQPMLILALTPCLRQPLYVPWRGDGRGEEFCALFEILISEVISNVRSSDRTIAQACRNVMRMYCDPANWKLLLNRNKKLREELPLESYGTKFFKWRAKDRLRKNGSYAYDEESLEAPSEEELNEEERQMLLQKIESKPAEVFGE